MHGGEKEKKALTKTAPVYAVKNCKLTFGCLLIIHATIWSMLDRNTEELRDYLFDLSNKQIIS